MSNKDFFARQWGMDPFHVTSAIKEESVQNKVGRSPDGDGSHPQMGAWDVSWSISVIPLTIDGYGITHLTLQSHWEEIEKKKDESCSP